MAGHFEEISSMSRKAIESASGNPISDQGIGRSVITDFLPGIPGLDSGTFSSRRKEDSRPYPRMGNREIVPGNRLPTFREGYRRKHKHHLEEE